MLHGVRAKGKSFSRTRKCLFLTNPQFSKQCAAPEHRAGTEQQKRAARLAASATLTPVREALSAGCADLVVCFKSDKKGDKAEVPQLHLG